METKTYKTYEEAAGDYLSRFSALRSIPPSRSRSITRGAGDIPAETFIERADEIADISSSMLPLAMRYLEAPEPVLREGISGQLLAQAAAELQVATELMQIAADETAGAAAPSEPGGITRAARGVSLRDAINDLENAMKMPVSNGLLPPTMVRRTATVSNTIQEAKNECKKSKSVTIEAILQHVIETGGNLALDLVLNTEWSAVIQSAGLMSKDIANLLDRLKKGVGDLVRRAITVATKTILNVYDKILALLGKDLQDSARKEIQTWLEKVKKAEKIDIFNQLVGKLYQVDKLNSDLSTRIDNSKAGMDKINKTTADVAALSDKFSVMVQRIKSLGDVIGLAKFFQVQFPQVLVVVTAIRIVLLAILVFGGYDYIDYKREHFINLTKGVAEVINEQLAV